MEEDTRKRGHSKCCLFDFGMKKGFSIVYSHEMPSVRQKLAGPSEFYLSLSSSQIVLTKFEFELWDHYILIRTCKGKPFLAYLDIEFAQMDSAVNETIGKMIVHSITLSKHSRKQSLYCSSEEEQRVWLAALKKHTILPCIHQDYIIKEVLGSGNYARVFRAKNIHTNEEVAVKTFDKQSYLNSEHERVA
jgi:hypothetical protein